MAADPHAALAYVTAAEFIELLELGAIHDELAAIRRSQATILRHQEQTMTAVKDLAAKDAALAAELDTFIADVKAKLDELGSLSPEDQAVVDQLGTDLDAFTAKLQGADPQQPAPAPEPTV